jgi:hypothetical protein
MDHNQFILTLDTTGPDVEVYMPTYATPEVDNEIIVQGSELLSPQQDFYFIDADGARHDFIFEYDGDQFIGLVRFNQFALGMATFYAQVRDEVSNPSALVTQSLNIMQGAFMAVCAELKGRSLQANIQTRNVDIRTRVSSIEVNIA